MGRRPIAGEAGYVQSGGKPQTSPVVEALVVKMAVENSYGNDSWGRRRIAGTLLALGHDIDPGTVRNILRRHGIPPAPNRGRGRDNDLQMVAETPADVAIDFAQTVVIDAGRISRVYILLKTGNGAVQKLRRNTRKITLVPATRLITKNPR